MSLREGAPFNKAMATVSVGPVHTQLITLTDVEAFADTILLWVINNGPSGDITVTWETSQDGNALDILDDTVTCPAGGQVSRSFGPREVRRFWGISGQSSGPTVSVVAGITVLPR